MTKVDRILQSWRISKVAPYLPLGSRICDIGCSNGAPLFAALPHLTGGVGIDPDLGPSNPPELNGNRLIRGLFPADLPDDRPFDAITMLAVLEHVPADAQVGLARDCARLLIPGGRLLITVPGPAVDHVLALLTRLRLIHGMSLEQHYGYEVAQTPATFGAAGLTLESWSRFQIGLNNLFVFRKDAPTGA